MDPDNSKKILIVEDEQNLLDILSDEFTRAHFRVYKAKDGVEGLEVALREHPDLILLDLIMPRMDGMTVLGKLRKDKWGRNVPVIVLSNITDDKKVSKAFEKEAHDFLIKTNWDLDEVVKKVKDKLETT